MKFKAKPKPEFLEEQGSELWVEKLMNTDGTITGNSVGNYLVGDIVEVNDEYIALEWWIPIIKDTLVEVKRCARCNNALGDCECE